MPEDGDPLTAASVRDALEEHADGLRAVTEHLLGTQEDVVRHSWHVTPLLRCAVNYQSYDTTIGNGLTLVVPNGDLGETYHFEVALYPAHGSTITAVRFYAKKDDTDTPRVRVYRANFEAYSLVLGAYLPTLTEIGDETTWTDVNADVSFIECAIDDIPVNRSRFRYFALVTGASDTNTWWFTSATIADVGAIDKGAAA